MFKRFLLLSWVFFIVSTVDVLAQHQNLPKLYKDKSQSVVLIKTDYRYIDPDTGRTSYSYFTASGVFIRKYGVILTSKHNINQTQVIFDKTLGKNVEFELDTINAIYNEKMYPLSIIALDRQTRLTLLTVRDRSLKFQPVRISRRNLNVGDYVFTIANPGRKDNVLKVGIVSSISSNFQNESEPIRYIFSNLGAERGDSGGPLFNKYGELIGINEYGSNSVLCASIFLCDKFVKESLYKLLNGHRIERPILNISFFDLSALNREWPTRAKAGFLIEHGLSTSLDYGILIIDSGQKEMLKDDVIIRINNIVLTNGHTFYTALFGSKPHKKIIFHVLRGGKILNIVFTPETEDIIPN